MTEQSQAPSSPPRGEIIDITPLFEIGGTVTMADIDAWSDGLMPRNLAAAVRRVARSRGVTYGAVAWIVVECSRPRLTKILAGQLEPDPDAADRLRSFLRGAIRRGDINDLRRVTT
jgi:hypothetical protein